MIFVILLMVFKMLLRQNYNFVNFMLSPRSQTSNTMMTRKLVALGSASEIEVNISEIRSKHWDARHNVYAYSLREGNIKRYSDDGEPSGTAGMPVLDVIVKNDLYDVCVVVTRYFGGILLGTGGLVRAYSQGSKIALQAGHPVLMQSCLLCEARCTYNQYGKISSLLIENGAAVDDTVYESDVTLRFHIPPQELDGLNKKLADATSGSVQAVSDGEDYFPTEIPQLS